MGNQFESPGYTDPTVDPEGSHNLLGPRLAVPQMGVKPEGKRPAWFIGAIFLGQFGLFVALLAPVMVSMQIKVGTLTDSLAEQATMIATIMPWGALAAVFFNALGGRLSDRTTWRWGRRRPWIIIGMIGLTIALFIVATGTSVVVLAIGWFLAQAFANLGFAAFIASLSDQLPDQQYGKTSGLVGIAQNLGIMVATWMGSWFTSNMLMLFMIPAVLGFVLMVGYALTIPDPVLKENRYPFSFSEFIHSFWTNPIKFPDFGLAWWGRFMIILASYLFTTFRLIYMEGHLGLSKADGVTAVATGVTIYTVISMIAGVLAGWLSDRTGRRKFLVAFSILVFALGTYLLVHADSVAFFYLCEAIMGLAYGTYVAVDLALVFEVLPDQLNNGKDLGVFNMANALPQSLAPGLGGWLLATLGGGTNFTPLLATAAAAGILGAILTMFIKSVK